MKTVKTYLAAVLVTAAASGAQAAQDANWHFEGTIGQIMPFITTYFHGVASQELATQPVASLEGMQTGDKFTLDIAVDLGANKAVGVTFSTAGGNLLYHADELFYSSPSVAPMWGRIQMKTTEISPTIYGPKELDPIINVAGLEEVPSFSTLNGIFSTGNVSNLSGGMGWYAGPASAVSRLANIGVNITSVAVTSVPEPSSMLMWGLGLFGLAAITRPRVKPMGPV
ncbi:MAG: PEP-CTERM sorting domain-containing protein [Aquabacterium sp.]|uniref:PEP-CTERM sorting domain-containing protein n=1 Tax=Aquabacterium sp. TaxID=1872578 RepID=UPI0025B943CD|nr:PEP-CTERM sorting domain-containing protein [Aquabacterium sp.]MBI3381869.1 PEP-CTERM sorting domain-containing protein [Aquabacterium sp.]